MTTPQLVAWHPQCIYMFIAFIKFRVHLTRTKKCTLISKYRASIYVLLRTARVSCSRFVAFAVENRLPTSQIKRRACNARMSKSIVRPNTSRTSLIVLEEHTDALTVVNTANGLGEDIANLEDLQLGAFLEVLFLGHGVGGDDLVNRTGVDTLHSIS